MRSFAPIPGVFAAIAMIAAALTFAPAPASADTAAEIEAGVNQALREFRQTVPGGADFAASAKGALIFPRVLKGGFFVGGEYGEGALREGGRTTGYFSTAAGSFGLQFGAQAKRVLIFFMTDESLASFKRSEGWTVGADASVALITDGLEGGIDSKTIQKPVVAFVISQKGLMAGVSIEGAKITRISR